MIESYPAHTTRLGPLQIWRALPRRAHRLIGAWCFLDRYGPLSFTDDKPMDVAPHPHIGIQTVSWLLEGEVLHRDSLGYEAMAKPGAVNIMSSGRGIAHAEETPASNIGRLNGVQLWVAQREDERHGAPSFTHIAEVRREDYRGGFEDIFYEPSLGRDVRVHARSTLELPLDPAFEHGLFMLEGDATFENQPLDVNTLYYLETGRASIDLKSANGARFLLLGGQPFPETVLMWWNFVARTPDEIAAARAEWEDNGARFGDVRGYAGPRLHAPELSRLADPNPAS